MARRTTLTQFLVEQQRAANAIKHELRLLIEVVARACKAIAVNVGKRALAPIHHRDRNYSPRNAGAHHTGPSPA